MGFFDVNFDRVTWQNIPVLLRGSVLFSWLKALIAPVKYVYGFFTANRAANLYRLANNSQVCYMERVLNDAFDPVLRGVYVIDGFYYDPVYTFMAAETKPVYLFQRSEAQPVTLYTRSEMAIMGNQFIVTVPALVAAQPGYSEARLRGLVDSYRLAGKSRYGVEIV